MCNSKFSGKPNEMLVGGGGGGACDGPGSQPRQGGGRKKVMSGTHCHFMLTKQG